MSDERIDGARAPREGDPERSGGSPSRGARPDPEVPERAKRRQFSAAYKERILREADGCRQAGEIGALLRREGLYSSHLAAWRKQRKERGASGLAGKKRGPAGKPKPSARELQLARENRKLAKKLAKAELVIEFQKNFRAPSAPPARRETPWGLSSRRPRGVAVSLLVPSSP